MWERVQELRKQRKRPNRYDEVGLFSGILFCADCGSVLYQQRYQNATRKQDCYICGSYKKRTVDCTAHFIRTDLLTAGVTARPIRRNARVPDRNGKIFYTSFTSLSHKQNAMNCNLYLQHTGTVFFDAN